MECPNNIPSLCTRYYILHDTYFYNKVLILYRSTTQVPLVSIVNVRIKRGKMLKVTLYIFKRDV